MSEAPALQKKVNPIKYLINGSFGGLLTVLVGHPLDTIKVRLQTMPKPAPGAEPMYRGMIDCMQKTIKNEGVRGLYRGMTAPLTTIAPIFAVYFAGFALGKRFQQKDENTKLTYPQIYISGAFSGIFATFISAPGERVKCLLQVQMATGGKFKYNGMTDTLSKLYKEGGLRCVFRGGYATLMRVLPRSVKY